MTYGIDVSLYQGKIDWTKTKVDFAMIRAATKKTFPDTYFETNYTEAKKAGIPLGAYYYMYATNEADALDEAKRVYELIKDKSLNIPSISILRQMTKLNYLEKNQRVLQKLS